MWRLLVTPPIKRLRCDCMSRSLSVWPSLHEWLMRLQRRSIPLNCAWSLNAVKWIIISVEVVTKRSSRVKTHNGPFIYSYRWTVIQTCRVVLGVQCFSPCLSSWVSPCISFREDRCGCCYGNQVRESCREHHPSKHVPNTPHAWFAEAVCTPGLYTPPTSPSRLSFRSLSFVFVWTPITSDIIHGLTNKGPLPPRTQLGYQHAGHVFSVSTALNLALQKVPPLLVLRWINIQMKCVWNILGLVTLCYISTWTFWLLLAAFKPLTSGSLALREPEILSC